MAERKSDCLVCKRPGEEVVGLVWHASIDHKDCPVTNWYADGEAEDEAKKRLLAAAGKADVLSPKRALIGIK